MTDAIRAEGARWSFLENADRLLVNGEGLKIGDVSKMIHSTSREVIESGSLDRVRAAFDKVELILEGLHQRMIERSHHADEMYVRSRLSGMLDVALVGIMAACKSHIPDPVGDFAATEEFALLREVCVEENSLTCNAVGSEIVIGDPSANFYAIIVTSGLGEPRPLRNPDEGDDKPVHVYTTADPIGLFDRSLPVWFDGGFDSVAEAVAHALRKEFSVEWAPEAADALPAPR